MADLLRAGADRAGRLLGPLVAPLFAAGSLARRARVFHPRGMCFSGRVEPVADDPVLGPVAERLRGEALVRFSGAVWKRPLPLPDILGCAVRIHAEGADPLKPGRDAQDLLFATMKHLGTVPFALWTTKRRDFFSNAYYAVAPFDVVGLGRAKLRVRGRSRAGEGRDREQRLLDAVAQGRAYFAVEIRREGGRAWEPLAQIALQRPLVLDQSRLKLSPFVAGRGLRPVGFFHELRRATYPLSQIARGAPA